MKKSLILIGIIIVSLILIFSLRPRKLEKESIIETKTSEKTEEQKQPVVIPEKFLMEVPFTSQSPFATWDEDENSACEEASLIMAWHWIKGDITDRISPAQAEEEIRALIAFENEEYGNSFDTSAKDTAQTFIDYYKNKNIKAKYDFTINEIIEEISKGSIVIVPANGIALNNPNFKQPGPATHMLFIKGYDQNKQEFITNDPGTKRGQGYIYTYDVLFDAIQDYPTGKHEPNNDTRKAMLVVNK
ncbi:MAG: C39 family peptidase [Candidatus Doudnabacteria bacterium]